MIFRFLRPSNAFGRITTLERKVEYLMTALDDLKAADAKIDASVAAAVSTINTDSTKLADLAAKLAAASPSDDSAALSALAADLSSKADALAAAVSPPAPAPAATQQTAA